MVTCLKKTCSSGGPEGDLSEYPSEAFEVIGLNFPTDELMGMAR